MVVVFECDETERLQHALSRLLHGCQDLGHAMNGAGLGLKCNFDEVTLCQRLRQAQKASGGRDGLKFCFGATAVFETDGSQYGVTELDASCPPGGVRLGELGHKLSELSHGALLCNRLLKLLVRIPHWGPELTACRACEMSGLAGCLLIG